MRILIFAPHNDDEVLGLGGTIAKYSKLGYEVYICEVTSGSNLERVNMIQSEALEAHEILGVKETIFLGLPLIGLKSMPTSDLNSKIQKVVERVKPNIAFIPHKGDMHIDHFEVAQSAMVALRPITNPQLKAIYSYETLSETEWSIPSVENTFIPNVWIDVTATLEKKLEAMKCYKSQLCDFPHPRSIKTIKSLSEYRGSTIGVDNAESFMTIRVVL